MNYVPGIGQNRTLWMTNKDEKIVTVSNATTHPTEVPFSGSSTGCYISRGFQPSAAQLPHVTLNATTPNTHNLHIHDLQHHMPVNYN